MFWTTHTTHALAYKYFHNDTGPVSDSWMENEECYGAPFVKKLFTPRKQQICHGLSIFISENRMFPRLITNNQNLYTLFVWKRNELEVVIS